MTRPETETPRYMGGADSRLSRITGVLGLVAFGTVVGMALCEILLRVAGYTPEFVNPSKAFHQGHPVIGYIGRPGLEDRFHKPEFDVKIAHGPRGFRKQEHQNPRTSTRQDIYVLGDSYTWGWGVGQGEVFTDQMSLLLPDRRVDNLGLTASGTAVQFQIFDVFVREKLAAGDLVIVTFCINDFGDNSHGNGHGVVEDDGSVRFVPGVMEERSVEPRRSSYLMNFLAFEWNYRQAVRRYRKRAKRSASRMKLRENDVVITTHYLGAIRDAAIDAGANLLLVRVPESWEFGPQQEDSTRRANGRIYREGLNAIAIDLGVEVIDLLPALREAYLEDPDSPLFFQHDKHWTARGHAVAAGAIARWLKRDGAGRPPDSG